MAAAMCGCKGVRSCALCEASGRKQRYLDEAAQASTVFRFCLDCGGAFVDGRQHVCGERSEICLEGVSVHRDFLTVKEEQRIIQAIDSEPWKPSQSGRLKQDYGPRPNFKKQRVKIGEFTGLPSFSREIVARIQSIESLSAYEPVEECHLDYSPERGSSIDAHRDDEWLWGEYLVTVNLLSDTFLTFVPGESESSIAILVPMPRRSLIIVGGDARYQWLHALRRCDISSRRVAITYRDLGPDFLAGGPHEVVGKQLQEIARTFAGKPT